MTEFSKRLQELMADRDMTAADVVRLSKRYDSKGISKPNMSHWMNGTYIPSTPNIYLLSQIFNVNPNYLMCDNAVSDSQKPMSDEEHKLIDIFSRLNEVGKAAALQRLEELTQLKQYAKEKKDP